MVCSLGIDPCSDIKTSIHCQRMDVEDGTHQIFWNHAGIKLRLQSHCLYYLSHSICTKVDEDQGVPVLNQPIRVDDDRGEKLVSLLLAAVLVVARLHQL